MLQSATDKKDFLKRAMTNLHGNFTQLLKNMISRQKDAPAT